MTDTLFDITYNMASDLGVLTEGTATGGSTTTIVDTNDRDEADDAWNDGTAWIIYDNGGEGAAPEGEFSIIKDFTAADDTITLRSTLTAAVTANDRYAICKDRYMLDKMIEEANRALVRIGPIVTVDTTSIDTAAGQTEYTLPAAANFDLREVYIQGRTNDDDDNRWIKIHNWKIQKTAAGTGDELILPAQYPSGRDVMLVYCAPHGLLRIASSKLDDSIHLERVVSEAVLGCLLWRFKKVGPSDKRLEGQIGLARERVAEAKTLYPIKRPRRTGKIFKPGPVGGIDTFKAPDE